MCCVRRISLFGFDHDESIPMTREFNLKGAARAHVCVCVCLAESCGGGVGLMGEPAAAQS